MSSSTRNDEEPEQAAQKQVTWWLMPSHAFTAEQAAQKTCTIGLHHLHQFTAEQAAQK